MLKSIDFFERILVILWEFSTRLKLFLRENFFQVLPCRRI